MKRFVLAAALLLGACSSNPLANRVSIPLAEDGAYVNSMYGPIGLTSKVDPKDAEILIEMRRLKAMVEALMRAQAQAQRAHGL